MYMSKDCFVRLKYLPSPLSQNKKQNKCCNTARPAPTYLTLSCYMIYKLHIMTNYPTKYESFQTSELTKYNYIEIA